MEFSCQKFENASLCKIAFIREVDYNYVIFLSESVSTANSLLYIVSNTAVAGAPAALTPWPAFLLQGNAAPAVAYAMAGKPGFCWALLGARVGWGDGPLRPRPISVGVVLVCGGDGAVRPRGGLLDGDGYAGLGVRAGRGDNQRLGAGGGRGRDGHVDLVEALDRAWSGAGVGDRGRLAADGGGDGGAGGAETG